MFLPTVNPADPENVFLRCDMTGAYVTHDGGESWRMFHLRAVVRDFEFDPGNPNVIYASNTGLYRSEDRGASWRLIYPDPANIVAERMVGDHAEQDFETRDGMPDGEIVKVRVDPADGNHLYLGLTPAMIYSAASAPRQDRDRSRVLVSTDRGASWLILATVEGRTVLAIIPGVWDNRPGEVTVVTDKVVARITEKTRTVASFGIPEGAVSYAEAGRGARGSIIYALVSRGGGDGYLPSGEEIFRSTDRGETWQRIMKGLLGDPALPGKPPVFSTLAVCEGNAETVYLSCSRYFAAPDKERQFGIFKTENAGERWQWVFRADSNGMLGTDYDGGWIMEALGPTWGEYPLSMGVSPSDPALCYASDFGCTYRSADGGATWRQVYTNRTPEGGWVSRGLDVTVCYGVQFDPFDPNHLFANYTDIGALQSFDGGRSWSHAAAGVPHRWANGCYWTVFDPEVQGRAWSVWSSAHDLPRQKMFRGGNFGRNVGGVALSEDGCRTWSPSNEGLPNNTPCTYLALDPASPKDSRTLYACAIGKGVFKSVDGGKSWKMTGEIPGRNKNAWQLKLLADGGLVLLVARGLENRQTLDGAVYTSRDGGDSWQPSALPEGVNAPNDLALDPANPRKMWLSLWPSTEQGREAGGGLLVTTDGGATWSRAFREDAHVFAAAVDPENPDVIFLNTFDSAAFRSADGGKSWSRIRGYGFKWGHRPIVDPNHPGMLYLTTFGGGLFYGPGAGDPEAREGISGFQESWRWGNDPKISY